MLDLDMDDPLLVMDDLDDELLDVKEDSVPSSRENSHPLQGKSALCLPTSAEAPEMSSFAIESTPASDYSLQPILAKV